MSAATEHSDAIAAVGAAKQVLATINAKLDAGDSKVTGADLVAAEASVTVAERLAAGAFARAEEEQAAEDEAQQAANVEKAQAEHAVTSKELTAAISAALGSLGTLLDVAQRHSAATAANMSAVGVGTRLSLPAPQPHKVLLGVEVLASQAAGIHVDLSHPHIAIEPLLPFIPAESR